MNNVLYQSQNQLQIVNIVLGVVNLSKSIFVILAIKHLVTLTNGPLKRHVLYLL